MSNPLISKTVVQPAPVKVEDSVLTSPTLTPEQHLSKIKTHIMTFLGKKGYNPYLYWRHNVQSLEKEYTVAKRQGKITEALVTKIMALPIQDPVVIGENSTVPEQIVDTLLTAPVDVNQQTKKID